MDLKSWWVLPTESRARTHNCSPCASWHRGHRYGVKCCGEDRHFCCPAFFPPSSRGILVSLEASPCAFQTRWVAPGTSMWSGRANHSTPFSAQGLVQIVLGTLLTGQCSLFPVAAVTGSGTSVGPRQADQP